MNQQYNMELAVELCKEIYQKLAPRVYPALTGGTLYKEGVRKDIDIVLYLNAYEEDLEYCWEYATDALKNIEILYDSQFWKLNVDLREQSSFVVKSVLIPNGDEQPRSIDFLFCGPLFSKEYLDRTETEIIIPAEEGF